MTDSPCSAVDPAALGAHAARVGAAVAALDPAALGLVARRIAAAAPGTRTAAAAEALALRWESAVRSWAADAGGHGAALGRSAWDYAATDTQLAAGMRAAS